MGYLRILKTRLWDKILINSQKEANKFLKEYTLALNLGEDTDKAGRILSSILHSLREVISTEESLQLIAQFPMFLKAIYVNGWSGRKKKKIKKSFYKS